MTQPRAAGARSVVLRFNGCINDRDIDGLAGLMSEDHTFIDIADNRIVGKQECLAAWRGFFAVYPDYRNVFASVAVREDLVVAAGHSVCTDPRLAGRAIWTARVRDGAVAEWRVHADTLATRERLKVV